MATAHYSTEVPHHVCLTSSELHEANIVAVVEFCEGIDKGEQPVRGGREGKGSDTDQFIDIISLMAY